VLPERLVEAVVELRADVVGLQEVDRSQPRSHGADLTASVAEAMGAEHWRFVPALIGTPGGTWRAAQDSDTSERRLPGVRHRAGLALAGAVLARDPAAGFAAALTGADPGHPAADLAAGRARVGLAAVVQTPAGPLTVGTTHLSFVPGWNGKQLRTFTAALGRLPGPRVLLGRPATCRRPSRGR
jgi:endonuclease/exonuclease/phosphatase family metal-dependent hydrolase